MDIESRTATRQYLPFVDWMKCVGMFLIVMGHVASRPTNHLLPPIYAKQLGVAFFMFVMGYSLARETKPIRRILFDRLFEIYLFGGAFAVLLSIIMYATRGTLQLSNYMPLVLGVNVLVNDFPANPTTWYIGTYLHVLVLWVIAFRRLRIRPWIVLAAVAIEIGLRALLIENAGRYIAYMLFTNWVSVFLLGMWLGQRAAATVPAPVQRRWQAAAYGGLLVAFLVGWFQLAGPRVVEYAFPFMRLSIEHVAEDLVLTSMGVSVVYLTVTWLVFLVTVRLGRSSWVQFFARNTLFIFIAHMPVFYWLDSVLARTTFSYGSRSAIRLLVCFVALAFVSEGVTRALKPKALRDRVRERFFEGIVGSVAAARPKP
jgi:hypothetical protein